MRSAIVACLSFWMAAPAAAQTSQPSTPAPDTRAQAYYEFVLGRHYEAEGEIDKAIAAHRQAARLDPSSASIRAELAALFARQGRLQDATTEARAALALDRDNREANRVLGGILASALDLSSSGGSQATIDEAIRCLERGRRSDGIDADPSVDITLARLYIRTHDNDKAIALLSSVVDREPIAEAYLLLAQAHQAAGHPAEASQALELGARENPRLFAPLGEFYDQQQQWGRAVDAYEHALAAAPQSAELKTRIATSLLNEGSDASLTRARELLRALVNAEPKNTRALYLLAQSERRLHDYTAAESAARQVQASQPDSIWAAYALAQIYEDQRQYRKVIDTLQPVMRSWTPSPDMPTRQGLVVLSHLGFAQLQMGDTEGAVSTFERARSLANGDTVYDMYLVQAYITAHRYEAAQQVLKPLRAKQPNDVRLAQLEARVLVSAGQRDQAIAVMQKAVADNPSEPAGWLSLADMLSDASRTNEALEVLDQAAAKFPANMAVPFQRGALFERAKEYARAEAAFRDVIARDPKNAPALNYLGYMFAERGERLDEAVELIQRALTLDPENGSYLDSLGWAYFKQNKLGPARDYLSRAADQLPANSVVQEHYGDVLQALGDSHGAIAAWQRALTGDRESIDVAVLERKIRDARERASR